MVEPSNSNKPSILSTASNRGSVQVGFNSNAAYENEFNINKQKFLLNLVKE